MFLILKIAVVAVAVLLAASLVALAGGNYRLHGRINTVFFILTLGALLGLEVVARLINPDMFTAHFERHQALDALWLHLKFSLPAAGLLFVMLFTGKWHWRRVHIGLGCLFMLVWAGTFVTGVFFLPHTEP